MARNRQHGRKAHQTAQAIISPGYQQGALLAANASTVDFLDLNHGWVADGTGTILYMTSDGGQSWTKITPGGNFKSITQLDFVSTKVGFAIGYTDSGSPFLLKTTDGGPGTREGPHSTQHHPVPVHRT